MTKPLILVTNDDGIHAKGLAVLVQHLAGLGEIMVAAPDQEQSAVGHSISLSRPLRVKEVERGQFAISGSPADSVLLALFHLCPRRPNLVISGINLGLNLGTDVFYSGTLAGALEGAIHGISAIAVSQEITLGPPSTATERQLQEQLERIADFVYQVASLALHNPLPPQTTLNINAPAMEYQGFCWTRLGRRAYREQVDKRFDLRGQAYYWIGGPAIPNLGEPGTDAHAVESGYVSITPLGLDLTREIPDCYQAWSMEGFRAIKSL